MFALHTYQKVTAGRDGFLRDGCGFRDWQVAADRGVLAKPEGEPLICGHCYRRDSEVDRNHVRTCGRVFTPADVEDLLQKAAPPFHLLLDGIAIAKREGRDDLRDRCIQFAVASVTGETPDHEIRNLAREAAYRELEAATEGTLREDAITAAARLRDLARRHERLAEGLRSDIELLDHLALYLGRGTTPAFVSASAALRRMQRADLSVILASRAVSMNPDEAAPRVTLAAALIDLKRAQEGLRESRVGEDLEPSSYTSSAMSRAHRALEELDEAIEWAEETIRRDPGGVVGYRTLVAAAHAAGDQARLERASQFLQENREGPVRPWSRDYVDFLTALEFIRTDERTRGLRILRRLASGNYRPAVRKLLEFEGPEPGGSRPPDQRPPR